MRVKSICHSDERSKEDGLLRGNPEKSRMHKVDALEILRRFAPLDDISKVRCDIS